MAPALRSHEKARLLDRAKLRLGPTLALIEAVADSLDLGPSSPGGVHPGLLRQRGAAAALGVSAHATKGAKLAGHLRGHAEALGLCVVEVPATEWRLGLTGRSNASDAHVERALRMRLAWTGRTNADERDAAGVRCGRR